MHDGVRPEWIAPAWYVVGSAPGAAEYFDALVATPCPDHRPRWITANAGAWLFLTAKPSPTRPCLYWLSDMVACQLFGRAADRFRSRGTEVVTLERDAKALQDRGLGDATTIEVEDQRQRFAADRWVHPRLSGLMCLQIAAKHTKPGGTIVMAGMTGYISSHGTVCVDTLDGRLGKEQGTHHTANYIAPFIQSTIEARPDVRFIFCGKPAGFSLEGDNVDIVVSGAELRNALTEVEVSR